MRRGLKICCTITAILLIILAAGLILYFTILKPREPKMTIQSVVLEGFNVDSALKINVTIGIKITVDNRNYGGFKYENSTTYISYRGMDVGEAEIQGDTIQARSKHNVSTSVILAVDKLFRDGNFLLDYFVARVVNFTSSTTLHGEAKVLKLFKKKASTYNTCDISLLLQNQTYESICKYKLKL